MLFEELGRQTTALGEISLRRRWDPFLETELYEVKLDDEFLMSSLFTVAETQLARLALAAIDSPSVDVLVGGLGLGYTARAALEDERVRRVDVVEYSDAVISWHREHLVPLGAELSADPRCRLHHGDFFASVRAPGPMVDRGPSTYEAVLLDIDHSPDHLLGDSHGGFYTPEGIGVVVDRVAPSGVFGMWADGEPSEAFLSVLAGAFDWAKVTRVSFPNPYTGADSSSTVYLAGRSG